ncbi:unnamed protein product [Phytophthora fragariaefolia]|uniref:Unnamed protein product n=1 Tax=Phytophthora fragariaefolia TaxID=1490495 RepID=A0A9W6YCV5_9STRA|nr:unnamed protein product [Phytophthora fragariaefolia]
MEGTIGSTSIIPGLSSSVGLVDGSGSTTQNRIEEVAMFTNPQGIYNNYSGKWDKLPGHKWKGKYWYEPQKEERKRIARDSSPEQKNFTPLQKAKQLKVVVVGSSGSESDAKLRMKTFKAAVRQPTTQVKQMISQRGTSQNQQLQRATGVIYVVARRIGHPLVPKVSHFCLSKTVHLAKDSTDTEAKARNAEYRRTHPLAQKTTENY